MEPLLIYRGFVHNYGRYRLNEQFWVEIYFI